MKFWCQLLLIAMAPNQDQVKAAPKLAIRGRYHLKGSAIEVAHRLASGHRPHF